MNGTAANVATDRTLRRGKADEGESQKVVISGHFSWKVRKNVDEQLGLDYRNFLYSGAKLGLGQQK